MPAIDIARLKIQAAALVEKFDQPALFIKDLREILDLYADRTLRANLTAPASVLPAYRAPQAVLRQIEMELMPLVATFPAQAMTLSEALWQEGLLETRLLAASLLGRIAPDTPQLPERISAWVSQTRDASLRRALLENSLSRLRRETPNEFLRLMETWFSPATPKLWPSGLQALLALIDDPRYDNLPPIFDLFQPVLENISASLQNETAQVINALYRASPVETVYFLRKTIRGSLRAEAILTLRRAIPSLAKTLQPQVQEMIRQKSAMV
ncbi:MAG: hypothetical protein OHK0031_18120 [Anaerolineales bacterium]